MLFFLAGLAGIPPELLDAAKIDGAGPWQRFLRITLPLLGPTLAFLLVIAVLNVLTQVDHVIVMTQGAFGCHIAVALLHLPAGDIRTTISAWHPRQRWSVSASSLRYPSSHYALERGIHYES